MEDFFRLVSGKEEIWFASNMDIYRYVQAQRNLEFSMDCSSVYNPSAISVWIGVEDKAVEIKPNQVCRL